MKNPSRLICLTLALSFFGLASSAQAADCRATVSVVNSAASVQANTTALGHVALHVTGNPTEAGKSRFTSAANFTSAFTAWKNGGTTPSPKVCGGSNSTVMDCVTASRVGITTANVCDTVDAQGNCTAQRTITPVKVAFRYAKSQPGSGGVWILNTAYPSANDNCS